MNMPFRRLLGRALAWLTLVSSISCIDPQVKRGRDALGQGRYTEALVTLRAVHTRTDRSPSRCAGRAGKCLSARANELMAIGACGSAADLIEEADQYTQPNRSDHRALHRCIEAHPTGLKNRKKILTRLVDIGERHGPVLKTLVKLVIKTGDHASVMKYAPMALARFALEPEDTRAIGFIFASAGRPQNAMTYFWHYLQADSTDPLVRLKVAEIQQKMGDITTARASYDALARDFSQSPRCPPPTGSILHATRRYRLRSNRESPSQHTSGYPETKQSSPTTPQESSLARRGQRRRSNSPHETCLPPDMTL